MVTAGYMVAANFALVFTTFALFNGGNMAFKEDLVMVEILFMRMLPVFVTCQITALICTVIASIHFLLAEKSGHHKAIVASELTMRLGKSILLAMSIPVLVLVIFILENCPWLAATAYCSGLSLFVLLKFGARFSKFAPFFRIHSRLVRLLRRFFWMTRKRREWLLDLRWPVNE